MKTKREAEEYINCSKHKIDVVALLNYIYGIKGEYNYYLNDKLYSTTCAWMLRNTYREIGYDKLLNEIKGKVTPKNLPTIDAPYVINSKTINYKYLIKSRNNSASPYCKLDGGYYGYLNLSNNAITKEVQMLCKKFNIFFKLF
jgi:hypothetical protein